MVVSKRGTGEVAHSKVLAGFQIAKSQLRKLDYEVGLQRVTALGYGMF